MFLPRSVSVRSRLAASTPPKQETSKVEEEERYHFVCLDTSLGNIILELYWNEAPKTCHNFVQLANEGYYDNTIFHRIIQVSCFVKGLC